MTPKLIYLADDERMITHVLEYAFIKIGKYEVKTFASGEDLLDKLAEGPDAVVLDYFFGDSMTGLDTLKQIKLRNQEVPVIMLTGQTEVDLKDAFYQNGACKYIHKSGYFVDEVLETIDDVLV